MSPIVSDASPLVALQQIERLDLLETIFGSLVIPPAVAREAANVPLGDWIAIRSLQGPLPPLVTRAGLGPGESESIGVALEAGADRMSRRGPGRRRKPSASMMSGSGFSTRT